MPIIGNSAVEVAWQLLQTLLFQYEEEHMTVLHRVVCEKMLHLGAFLPYWLTSSYKVGLTNKKFVCNKRDIKCNKSSLSISCHKLNVDSDITILRNILRISV